jgi:hypothetical protein
LQLLRLPKKGSKPWHIYAAQVLARINAEGMATQAELLVNDQVLVDALATSRGSSTYKRRQATHQLARDT